MILNSNVDAGPLEQVFYQVGNNGPFILTISSLLLLKNKQYYFEFYLIGSIVNFILNQFLKLLIKQPRPSVDQKTFDLAMKHMKSTTNYANLISYDKVLGMPSGHAQGVLFSTAFIYFVFYQLKPNNTNTNILLFYLFISFITIIQRVYYKFHTINQIIVGGLLGIGFSYLVYNCATKKLKGSLKWREEENGPL
jgi:membrane-associated phospholipid phosphatase